MIEIYIIQNIKEKEIVNHMVKVIKDILLKQVENSDAKVREAAFKIIGEIIAILKED